MPNVAVEPDDDAPDVAGAMSTATVVSIASTSPNPSARLPVNVIMAHTPSLRGRWRPATAPGPDCGAHYQSPPRKGRAPTTLPAIARNG